MLQNALQAADFFRLFVLREEVPDPVVIIPGLIKGFHQRPVIASSVSRSMRVTMLVSSMTLFPVYSPQEPALAFEPFIEFGALRRL